MSEYLFDNASDQAPSRFAVLETCFDPASRQALARTGLSQGWKCLEVGAGAGSLGWWLGERVGADGRVTVTDIEPRWPSAPPPSNIRYLRHDIVRDELTDGDYDLIHARLVLLHLPERLEVLNRLVDALRPGGWLVLELEGRPRGLYAGAVMTCDAEGALDAALVLRSVFQRDGATWIQAGAGIVRQSRPEREHEETSEKLRSIATHLVPAARD